MISILSLIPMQVFQPAGLPQPADVPEETPVVQEGLFCVSDANQDSWESAARQAVSERCRLDIEAVPQALINRLIVYHETYLEAETGVLAQYDMTSPRTSDYDRRSNLRDFVSHIPFVGWFMDFLFGPPACSGAVIFVDDGVCELAVQDGETVVPEPVQEPATEPPIPPMPVAEPIPEPISDAGPSRETPGDASPNATQDADRPRRGPLLRPPRVRQPGSGATGAI
ncbi:MAG: hypothetical protein ABIH69_05285 [bacterium]